MAESPTLDDGYRALAEGCGLLERPGAEALEVTGEDRQRFLNGLVTCDVAALAPGQGAYGFFTGVKGKILADVAVLALDDRLWLELPPGRAGDIKAHCEKYRIVDRVDFAPLARVATTLLGPDVETLLALELPAAPLAHVAAERDGIDLRAVREVRFGGPGATLWTSPADAPRLADGLRAAGAAAVPCQALDAWRIERGWPIAGVDYAVGNDGGGESFPQETGLGDLAVSYTKGCYLGQEVVARIHYRGGVNRHLRGLRLGDVAGTLEDLLGTELVHEGRAVGTLRSVARSPRAGVVGLAIVHRRGAEPGTRLGLAAGDGEHTTDAEVVELPF